MWPFYYKELLKIGNPKSQVGISTCWTICDEIIKEIPNSLYAVAGQLYTKNGLNYMVRNLLLNKNIRYLILCGQDRGGSGEALRELWKTGKSNYLHKEIEEKALKNMIENVQLIDLANENNGNLIRKAIEPLNQDLPSYGKTEKFPEPKERGRTDLLCHFPTDSSVFKVRGKNVAETWLKILKNILKFGDVKETDSMKIKEILNVTAVVENEDADNFFLPEYLGFNEKKLNSYLPQILEKEKFDGLHYTYGNRLRGHFGVDQLEEIIKKLKNDRNAREAVGVLFDPRVDVKAEHRPCITLIQALFNQDKLNLNVYVRSHDMFGGWPLNAFGMRKLQQKIAREANLPIGVLTFISASAHIYDFNWEEAKKIVEKNSDRSFENDPRGFFKIDIDKENKKIKAEHFSPGGLSLQSFTQSVETPKAALELARQIENSLGISLTSHAIDLGIELQKAETALRLGVDYVQDQPFLF